MRIALFIFAACFLMACIEPVEPQSTVPQTVISEHIRAFNAGDVEAMAKMQHPNIQWLSISGNSVSVQVAGRDALSKNMSEYFKSPTKVKSTVRDWNINGPYVSVTEIANWNTKDGISKSQSSMTVYELEDNLIRRVWYYPAVEN